tara:strand:- start:2088 stop:2468 length:381 start_codon:yes stop_codon:yes gene_type:complete
MSKYIFWISLVLNGILLMFLVGVVPFLLYLSALFNVLMTWFVFKTLRRTNNTEEDLIILMSEMEEFLEQLQNIHAMEMYYGDTELQNLINNSKALINNFIDVQAKYFDVEVEFEPDDEAEEEAKEE